MQFLFHAAESPEHEDTAVAPPTMDSLATTPVTSTWEVPSSPNPTPPPSWPPASTESEAPQQSVLKVTAPPFVSRNSAVCATKPSTKDAKGKNKKLKNNTANDHESIELEYAKYEVNVTQAKLRTLETTNRDLKFRNSILESRVEELEKKQKQDIYERYFPRAEDAGQSRPSPLHSHCAGSTDSQPPPQHCHCPGPSHLVLSCCSCPHAGRQRQCWGQSTQQNVPEKSVQDIVNQMNEIKLVTAELKSKLDTIFVKIKTPVNVDTNSDNDSGNHAEDEAVPVHEISETSIDHAIHDVSDDLN